MTFRVVEYFGFPINKIIPGLQRRNPGIIYEFVTNV